MLSYLVYLRLLKQCSNFNRYQCIGVWDDYRLYTFFLRLNETLRYGIRADGKKFKENIALRALYYVMNAADNI
ncbi:unnamed protein product [Rotaria sp. Silwood1]|nr:unnamed protein product [Rotaria sp. Silwood1]CAF1469797.1 unnamed protein product [Rotaria sp. Silwood1]CAF1520944.1 unnamed protein product [Rotaria sp. Silwood1]